MQNYDSLRVYLNNERVGSLLTNTRGNLVSFSYDKVWLSNGFSISPFSLPLKEEVFVPEFNNPFEGLFGIFSDSLPDGWGRLVLDRLLRTNGINPYSIDSLNRLALIGSSGMGALRYEPEHKIGSISSYSSFDELAKQCQKILESKEDYSDLDLLFALGGSSGGARPKVLVNIDSKPSIVKFKNSEDNENIGQQEYDYMACAKECNIKVPNFNLLPSEKCKGYFSCERFDRKDGVPVHMASVSALLETSHRIPNLDYNTLMALTIKLTKGNTLQSESLYRLMCFNVFAHNRDDHSKNFSFLYVNNNWELSPAYDLTYSNSIGGEHATTINGKGKNITLEDVVSVGIRGGLHKSLAIEIAEKIKTKVEKDLGQWL